MVSDVNLHPYIMGGDPSTSPPPTVGRCKLDPSLKARMVSKVQPREEKRAFNLKPGLSEPSLKARLVSKVQTNEEKHAFNLKPDLSEHAPQTSPLHRGHEKCVAALYEAGAVRGRCELDPTLA